MGTLWLYAISLDLVRGFFGAAEPDADVLLAQAAAVTTGNNPPKLLGRIGPLTRRPVAPAFPLPGPTADDARALAEGRSLPADRLGPAWVIVRHWCALRADETAEITVDRHPLAVLDFHLVASGLASQYSVETILARDPHLPLLPVHGLSVGWMPAPHAALAAQQWQRNQLDELPDNLTDTADELANFFAGVGQGDDVLAMYQ